MNGIWGFAPRLQAIMKDKGMSVTALATKIDPYMKPELVWQWVNGYAIPATAYLWDLRRALGVSWDELMGE